MSDSTTSEMIKLKSSDGKEFEVPETVLVKQSQTISRLIEEACTKNSIPLVNVNVTAPVLEKVFEYCMKHVEAADASKTETTGEGCINSDKELRNWDKQFVDNDNATLYELIMAANNLNIEGLLDSMEEICQAFNIKDNNFTAYEE
ncbi:SKP1-like protein 1A [Carex littledalei]|uniref:SKP1-like protein n=1 Tax=Carex littledalei TaxID=544730 RepID=A0A833QZD6_9POAL|nr:SKP1-like protein 1A [Carex littledalei]